MKKKFVLFFVCLVAVIGICNNFASAEEGSLEKVYFKDDKVRMEVVESLKNKDNLIDESKKLDADTAKDYVPTRDQMRNLKALRIGPIFDESFEILNVDSLKGIEEAVNLEDLHISSIHCKDLSLLANFTKLKKVYIKSNDLENLDFLKDLRSLEDVNVNSNNLTSLKGLENLNKLKILTATENNIGDISAISKLSNLEELYLDNNKISDLNPIKDLTNLKVLKAQGNIIKDITPLENLVNLTSLHLNGNYSGPYDKPDPSGNAISDISPLKNLKNLEVLYLQDLVYIKDLTPLKDLTKLKNLVLRGNMIEDISPLENLTDLEVLYLYKNKVKDISPLAKMSKMRELNFAVNKVKDISALYNMKNLNDVKGYSNEIEDISPLRECRAEIKNFSDNKIIDLSSLNSLVENKEMGSFYIENQNPSLSLKLTDYKEEGDKLIFRLENPIISVDGKKVEVDSSRKLEILEWDENETITFKNNYNRAYDELKSRGISVKSEDNYLLISLAKDLLEDKISLPIPYELSLNYSNEDEDFYSLCQVGGVVDLTIITKENKGDLPGTDPIPGPNPGTRPDPKPETKPEVKPEKNIFEGIELGRQAGDNRYKTAVEISKKNFDTAETVILVNGEKEADALAASVLAKEKNAPILLIKKDMTPEEVAKEIERLGAKNIILIGGLNSITQKAVENLKQNITRIAGKDRFETAVEIAKAAGKT
ncbi:leucine-rich repeat domain-containing protein, partial [Citroniella saccharovorans]